VGDLEARVCITGFKLLRTGKNNFVSAVMNIPDKGKQRMFYLGLADKLSVSKEIFCSSEVVKLLSALY
jgi:hypothetical protein